MPVTTVELNARKELVSQPIIWRLGKLFRVVTNLRRARVTEDYAHVLLEIEGSTEEVAQAVDYLRSLGVTPGGPEGTTPPPGAAPENAVPQPNTIYVRLRTVNPEQAHVPFLYRISRDYNVVVNVEQAAFNEEEGGIVWVTISGPLVEVQRAIAYLHTTGLHVDPRQRSVTDHGNL